MLLENIWLTWFLSESFREEKNWRRYEIIFSLYWYYNLIREVFPMALNLVVLDPLTRGLHLALLVKFLKPVSKLGPLNQLDHRRLQSLQKHTLYKGYLNWISESMSLRVHYAHGCQKKKALQCTKAHFTHICNLGFIISWSYLNIWNDWCSLFDTFNFYMILLHMFHEVMPYCKSRQHEPWYIPRYLANSWYAIILWWYFKYMHNVSLSIIDVVLLNFYSIWPVGLALLWHFWYVYCRLSLLLVYKCFLVLYVFCNAIHSYMLYIYQLWWTGIKLDCCLWNEVLVFYFVDLSYNIIFFFCSVVD